MSGKDAVEVLKNTNDFKNDFQNNSLGFNLIIDDFADESDEFHYLRTTYLDQREIEHTIFNYRINSKFGYIEKKVKNEDSWIKVN